jgi:hypothetical protein
MPRFLFVGERPSPKAAAMQVTWKDGRLAAKQLFDALRACGFDPSAHRYDNVFRPDPVGPETVCKNAIRRIRRAVSRGVTAVAMGQKAARVLVDHQVNCLTIVHPAARGRIRKKARYAKHIRETLGQGGV